MNENTTIRAKMSCTAVVPAYNGSETVHFSAVYSTDPTSENKKFSDATPSAYMQLNIAKDAPAFGQFQIGQHYYFDMILAPKT